MTDKFWEERGMDCGVIEPESEYESMTDEAVAELAQKILSKEVFGSWQIERDSPVSVEQVFVFLLLMDEISMKRVLRDRANYIYEYVKAADKMVNGYPIFYSGCWLDTRDFGRVMKRVLELEGL